MGLTTVCIIGSTGRDGYEADFALAESEIRETGCIPMNPARSAHGDDVRDTAREMVMAADMAYLLDGWDESEDARSMARIAMKLGLDIVGGRYGD